MDFQPKMCEAHFILRLVRHLSDVFVLLNVILCFGSLDREVNCNARSYRENSFPSFQYTRILQLIEKLDPYIRLFEEILPKLVSTACRLPHQLFSMPGNRYTWRLRTVSYLKIFFRFDSSLALFKREDRNLWVGSTVSCFSTRQLTVFPVSNFSTNSCV